MTHDEPVAEPCDKPPTRREIEILSAKPEGVFEAKAKEALARWAFSPGKDEAGNAVAMCETVLLVFKLEDAR